MKYNFLFLLMIAFASCSDSFINHKVEYKKTGACTEGEKAIKMEGNIAGERYIFETCTEENFDGKNYSVTRVGDSLVVDFPKAKDKAAAFEITLDIDAKPVYNYIVINGKSIPIRHVE